MSVRGKVTISRLISKCFRATFRTKNLFLIFLVMNAAMKLGNAGGESAIVFDNKNLIKQYIDPATMAVKFYACKDNRDTIDISEILKAFGEGKLGIRGLLDNSTLKGLCVSYHDERGESNLKVISQNKGYLIDSFWLEIVHVCALQILIGFHNWFRVFYTNLLYYTTF